MLRLLTGFTLLPLLSLVTPFLLLPVVARVAGDLAVLSSGPSVGTQVVSVGVAELFGTEFEFDEE